MTSTTTTPSFALVPSVETASQDVDSSFERFCLSSRSSHPVASQKLFSNLLIGCQPSQPDAFARVAHAFLVGGHSLYAGPQGATRISASRLYTRAFSCVALKGREWRTFLRSVASQILKVFECPRCEHLRELPCEDERSRPQAANVCYEIEATRSSVA
jgi:hypothetical protein